MDKLNTGDILEALLAGSYGWIIAFYVMGLDGSDAMYVGGIVAVSKIAASMTIGSLMSTLMGVTLS
jgi:predicted membrane protein